MKSDLERAKKLLEYLDRFAQTPITSATISSDGVCYSENNLSIIAKALSEVRAEERERCAKVAEGASCENCACEHAHGLIKGEWDYSDTPKKIRKIAKDLDA